MFRQILVATDLTRISRNALGRADALARDERAHLHISVAEAVVRDSRCPVMIVQATSPRQRTAAA